MLIEARYDITMPRHLPAPRPTLASKMGWVASLPVIVAIAGCGPVHPRWRNASGNDIVVSYVRDASVFRTEIRDGAEGMPADFLDFQKVQRIEVTDAGKTYRLGSRAINKLHDGCGHGYKCRINYFSPGHITVSAG